MPSKGKILIIDDEEAILKVLSIKLRVSGYGVITAPDGEKGLELAGSKKPDLILLDLVLPKTDGFRVLEKLSGRVKLPIIAFSAYPENALRAISLGVDDFIAKPFDIDVLLNKIGKLLNT